MRDAIVQARAALRGAMDLLDAEDALPLMVAVDSIDKALVIPDPPPLTDHKCESCGGTDASDEPDGFWCHGCGRVICRTCCDIWGHYAGGDHALGDPVEHITSLRDQLCDTEEQLRSARVDAKTEDRLRREAEAKAEYVDLHMHRMLALAHSGLEGRHVSTDFGGNAPEDVQGFLDKAFDVWRRMREAEDKLQAMQREQIDARDALNSGIAAVIVKSARIAELEALLRRIMRATPHSMCSDAEAWVQAEAALRQGGE